MRSLYFLRLTQLSNVMKGAQTLLPEKKQYNTVMISAMSARVQ